MHKTIKEILSVELVTEKGLVIRFLSDQDEECVVQVPFREAHALADMIAIALSRQPMPPNSH